MSTKKWRIEQIGRKSQEYAKSGDYDNWLDIERALVNEGLYEARTQLDSRHKRAELNEFCRLGKEAKAAGMTFLDYIHQPGFAEAYRQQQANKIINDPI